MLNREFQKECLVLLKGNYPEQVKGQEFSRLYFERTPIAENASFDEVWSSHVNEPFVLATLSYLSEHNLIETERVSFEDYIPRAKITAKGLDFLEDDGGLSAILNTVTVKFDVDNIRQLVEAGLLQAHMPEEQKGALQEAIRNAPGTILQTAMAKMVEKGIGDPIGTAKAVAGLFGISW